MLLILDSKNKVITTSQVGTNTLFIILSLGVDIFKIK